MARPTAHQRPPLNDNDKSNLFDQQRNGPAPKKGDSRAKAKGANRDTTHSERRSTDTMRSTLTQVTRRANAPAAHLPPDDKSLGKKNEQIDEVYKSPTTGRNTKLGRRVEKPMDPKAGGPSGQLDRAKHDKRHANK